MTTDVIIAVVPFTARTTTGTQNITDSAQLGGVTPKGCIVVMSWHQDANGNTPTAGHRLSVGFYDGTAQRCYSAQSASAQANSQSRKDSSNTAVIATSNIVAAATTFIADGVTLNFTTTAAGAWRGYVIFFAGATDCQVKVGDDSLGASAVPLVDITSPGFLPDVVFFAGIRSTGANNTNAADAHLTFGIALQDATQRCIVQNENFNDAAGGNPKLRLQSNHCAASILDSNGALDFAVTASAFDANGFSIQASANAGNALLGWMAVRLGGMSTKLFNFQSPVATGNAATTTPGFEPSFGMIVGSSQTALDSSANDVDAAASVSLSAFNVSEQQAHASRIRDDADPTDTANVLRHSIAALFGSDQSLGVGVASLVSFDSLGWTLNYSAAPGSALYGIGFAAGETVTIAETRITQAAGIVGIHIDNVETRITQTHAIVGVRVSPNVRLTQAVAIVGIRNKRPPCLTREADCWRIERADGTVYRFTSHDRQMTLNGEVYTPCGGITPSALQLSAELGSTDNLDLAGIMYEGGISEVDIWAGKFDGASVEFWRVSWDGSTTSTLVAAGKTGSVQFGDNSYKFEIISAAERLQQRAILQPVMPTCRFKLGDSRCTVDLGPLTVTGTVTGVPLVNIFTRAKRRTFTDTARAEADQYFQFGRLTWTGGANAGFSSDVRTYANDQFVLDRPSPAEIQIGDTYSVVPGCDLLDTTCETKFNNRDNFGGFKFVRGYDDLNKRPKQDI